MIFVLDNYDSFTYNLVQYLGELGAEPVVYRNDALTVEEIERLEPEAIVISPGPGTPADAGVSVPLIRHFVDQLPILGVCLGHQALGEAFGGRIIRAERLMHGKTSPVEHTGEGLFERMASPITAMRYHSLLVDPKTVPADLKVTAWTADRPRGSEIMALQHRTRPVFGVQFHPESVGTEVGKQLVKNFLAIAAASGGRGKQLAEGRR
jgi:anthranilate synthase/aminodeoxychorismate synthase-like glutamine amidotransferase